MKSSLCVLASSFFLLLSCDVIEASDVNFDETIANRSIILSAKSYCDYEQYENQTYVDIAPDFKFFSKFSDVRTDMQGFIGHVPGEEQIWVVYRGSQTFINYWDDVQVKTVNASIADCQSCMVHHGMKICHDETIDQVLADLKILKESFPLSSIILTGHSLGAAVATLAAVSLENMGGFDVTLYSIGSPRVGNAYFAAYVDSLFPLERSPRRITHSHDMVPHVPFESFGYKHFATEFYEDEMHVVTRCNYAEQQEQEGEEGEELKSLCAEKWTFSQTTVADHMLYLGHPMTCATATHEQSLERSIAMGRLKALHTKQIP